MGFYIRIQGPEESSRNYVKASFEPLIHQSKQRHFFGCAEALRDDWSLMGEVAIPLPHSSSSIFLRGHLRIIVEDEEVSVQRNFDSVKNIVPTSRKSFGAKLGSRILRPDSPAVHRHP